MSASSKKKLRKEQNFVQLTEKQLAEQKEAKKLKINTIIFTVVILAVLVTGIVVMALSAFNSSGIAERNTTAMTVGEHKLTAAELNYFFMDGINNFYREWYNSYGDYAATYMMFMMGLDVTQPLDKQVYDEEAGTTFADYFSDAAVNSAVSAYSAYDLALEAGNQLTDADKETIELTMSSLTTNAMLGGYGSAEDYLKAMYGKGATEKTFRKYLEVINMSNAFLSQTYEGFTYDEAALNAHSEAHFDDYSSFSYCTFTVNPSTFLECTASEDDKDHVHTVAENEAALAGAKEAADAILAAAPTDVESFNAAIKAVEAYAENENATCSEVDAVLFSEITNEKLSSWLGEEGRKSGDVTLLTNETTSTGEDGKETSKISSYTVALMLERNDNNMPLVNVRHILKSYTGGTTDEYGTTTYSDEEKKVAMDAIKLLEENFKSAGATEEVFSNLAKDNSTDPGSASNGGLYENVYPGQMVETFNDWCFDSARKPGDTGIVETQYGVHLLYFVGNSDITYRNFLIENELRNADYETWMQELVENADHEVLDTSKLSRSMVLNGN